MPISLPLQSINHVSFDVADLEVSMAFYRDVLGFQRIRRPHFPLAPGIWLYNYGLQLHLKQPRHAKFKDSPQKSNLSVTADHLAFYVTDTDEVERLLKQHDIPYRALFVEEAGITMVFFQDPDGNHLEVGTYPPPVEFVEG